MSRAKVTRARNEKKREIAVPRLFCDNPARIDRHNIKSLNIRSDKEAEGGTWNRTRKGWLMRPLSGHRSLPPYSRAARTLDWWEENPP